MICSATSAFPVTTYVCIPKSRKLFGVKKRIETHAPAVQPLNQSGDQKSIDRAECICEKKGPPMVWQS